MLKTTDPVAASDIAGPAADGHEEQAPLRLVVNGIARTSTAGVAATLLTVLREECRLTGAKQACGRGECGACTVLVDGVPVLACITLAHRVRHAVTTVEGLAEECRDLREAFADHGGFQCGFCTSGQIVRAAALLREGLPADPVEAARTVRFEMSGNLCRCTGYDGIVAAILAVAERRRARAGGPP